LKKNESFFVEIAKFMKKGTQISLYVLLLLLLATPWFIRKYSGRKNRSFKTGNEAAALAKYGFYLQEVSSRTGIHFTHQAPRLDSVLSPIMQQVASMGASVVVADFNNDGWEDIYLTNSRKGTKNALYENMKDGTFKDVAAQMGVAKLNTAKNGVSMGAVWGDYDNDGYPDLFVYRWGKPVLFHNDHGKGFTKVSQKRADFPDWVNANTAIWFDYNNDGYLDLFLGGYYRPSIDLWHLKTTKIMPNSFEYADNGGRNYLFRNNGDGTFTEVAQKMGLKGHQWTLAAGAADLNGDGYPDLVIANDYGDDQLFINEQGNHFRNVADHAKVGSVPKSGMSVSFGDILNQGKLDIYISNISQGGVLVQGNNLWVPRDIGERKLNYANLAGSMSVELGGWSWGAQFGDLNNDGFVDLYLANGYISGKKGSSYWYDYSLVTSGNKKIIADAKNWPAFNGRSLAGYEQNKIWINNGAGRFHNAAGAVGDIFTPDSRSVAFADLWNQGVLDVIVANQNGSVRVFKNTVTKKHHWIGFQLTGMKSNRSAIGAQVVLYWNGQRQKQVITAGIGFSSENQRRVHFGIGKSKSVQKVVIYWPSGEKQVIRSPAIDQLHIIKESE
jgi:hypothetical protein